DCENDLGWSLSVTDDGATFGRWVRKNPNGSFLDSILVQPELDHTPLAGVKCFITANFPRNYGVDVGDVDGGKTTLTSPQVNLSQYASAHLRYARWYTNDTGSGAHDDVWRVDISSDSGATWTSLENTGAAERAWVLKAFNLGDYGALTDKVLVRFVASDFGQESTVEAGVDDIEITGCPYWVDVTPPSVTVIAPNGGEELTENTDYQIRWQAVDDYGIRQFRVLASYDGGLTYPDTLGAAGARDSSLVWHVPAGSHPDCAIRVSATDRGYNVGADESDAPFAIVRDAAGVTPTPGEQVPDHITFVGSERNPFTGSTHIFFGLPGSATVRIAVYDATGRLSRVLLDGTVAAGYHSTVWDGKSGSGAPVAPGVYFVRFEAGAVSQTAKVVLAR
ncbi:MAG TPA: FlgD immunoglobulin-like domain containing protein, partial [bacterium]|nr:FlgD immunoglobulin-like domain containing protein [bacterium]